MSAQVIIRYSTEGGHVQEATAALTSEEEILTLEARDRAQLLGDRARTILRDFGLDPGWTPATEERPEPDTRGAGGGLTPLASLSVPPGPAEVAELLTRLEALEAWRREWLRS